MFIQTRIISTSIVIVFAAMISGCNSWNTPSIAQMDAMNANASTTVPPLEPGTIVPPGGEVPYLQQQPFLPPQPSEFLTGPVPRQIQGAPYANLMAPPGLQNPLFVPVYNHDAAWEAIVDVTGDYFRISKENRVHQYGGVLSEGRIETYPQGAATHPELHRKDTVGRFNRWQSTLQTIRRTGNLRVIPTQGGYLIEVVVTKELEDLPRPEHSTAGAATFRSDGSLPSRRSELVSNTRQSDFWIPLGREPLLEQKILADLRAKLDPTPSGVVRPAPIQQPVEQDY